MTSGLDKIIEKINADSASKCVRIIEQAQRQARDIELKAERDGELEAQQIISQARKKADSILKMSEANCQQLTRKTILAARVAAVDDAIADAAQTLCDMPQDEYFSALKALAVKNACPGEGVMRLNAADSSRLPADFIKDINAALPQGYGVTLSEQAAQIKNGFILIYGDIEINCTFDALIDAQRDAVKEKVCSIIF